MNKVLKSKVIKEYFRKVKSFSGYEFPFYDNKISDYLWKKTMFIDLDEQSWGITNREGFGIFINRKKGKNSIGLGYGIYIITLTHEFIGHFLAYLVNSNNKIKVSKFTPDQSFIDEKDNILSQEATDGGDKLEILLFGERVNRLFIGGNHFLMNIENWDLSLEQFQKKFKKNNIIKPMEVLKKELEILQKDNNVKIFLKNIDYNDVKSTINSQSMISRNNEVGNPQIMNMTGFR